MKIGSRLHTIPPKQIITAKVKRICDLMKVDPKNIDVETMKLLRAQVNAVLRIGHHVRTGASEEIKNRLLKAKSLDLLLEVMCDSLITLNVCSGSSVYIRDTATNQIRSVKRKHMNGASRYEEAKLPDGEKRQLIYRINDAVKAFNAAKRNAAQEGRELSEDESRPYVKRINMMRFWHIADRREWPEYGVNRSIVDLTRKKLDEFGIENVENEVGGDAEQRQLTKMLVDHIKEELPLTETNVERRLHGIFALFMQGKVIVDHVQKEKYQQTFDQTLSLIQKICSNTLREVYPKAKRIADDWAEQNKTATVLNEANFSFSVCNYINALKDLENDVRNYGCNEEKVKENFYYVVLNKDKNSIALVLVNNHEENTKNGAVRALFPSETKLANTIRILDQLDGVFALGLSHEIANEKEKAENKEKIEEGKLKDTMINLMQYMSDNKQTFSSRLQMAVNSIARLSAEKRKRARASMLLMDRDDSNKMTFVATSAQEKEDEKSREIIGKKINIGEGIAGWAIEKNVDIFEKVRDLKIKHPELISRLNKHDADPDETVIVVRLKEGDKVIGALCLSGMDLSERDIKIMRLFEGAISAEIVKAYYAQDVDRYMKELERLSNTDQLTGVPNRRMLDMVINDQYEESKQKNTSLSYVMMDLDRLKPIDDVEHLAGDHVLRSVAQSVNKFLEQKKLQDKKFENVFFARYGGDEFVMVASGFTEFETEALCKEVQVYMEQPSQQVFFEKGKFAGEHMSFTFSMGIASMNDTIKAKTHLMDNADSAVYWKKRHGKNGICIFNYEIGKDVIKLKEDDEERARMRVLSISAQDLFLEDVEGKDMDSIAKVDEAVELAKRAIEIIKMTKRGRPL